MVLKTKLSYLTKRRICIITSFFIPLIIITIFIILNKNIVGYKKTFGVIYLDALYILLAFIAFIFVYLLIIINRI